MPDHKTIHTLIALGLTEKEAQVYLELLELGPQPASIVARRLELPRSTAKFLADILIKKQFASGIVKNHITHYTAKDPAALKQMLEVKRLTELEKIDQQKLELEKILPALSLLGNSSANVPKIRYFEGFEGIKAMYEEVIAINKPMSVIPTTHQVCDKVVNYLKKHYRPRRNAQDLSGSRVVVFSKKRALEYMQIYKHYRGGNIRIIDPKILPTKNTVQIYSGRVAIYSCTDEKNLFGIIVENPTVYETFQVLFSALWGTGKPATPK
jgi:sugar-specific transcriptional regulator TrmB